ncbi:hypothetical protein DMH03_41875, partial [Amycolatopsis sp. WAC 01376]
VLPRGLTRAALPEGSLGVNSSQGGRSKATWVLAPRSSTAERALERPALRALPEVDGLVAAQGPELTPTQQQQQQQA